MRKKINLVILLMAFCTVFLVGLQLFWNYQAYHNDVRVFKSDINNALDKAVNRLADMRRDEFAAQYKKWLADTSLVEITCRYGDTVKATIFYVRDKHPPYKNRVPFTIGLNDFKQQLKKITPSAKAFFIDHFVKNLLRRDLESGSAYYYTERLGDSLVKLFNKDRLNIPQLTSLYNQELAKRDINSSFHLKTATYVFKGFKAAGNPNESAGATRQFQYGFSGSGLAISAVFPDPGRVFLQKMKWVLLSSLLLIGITITCFTYTVKTLLSQKKLKELKDDFVNNMTHELKTPVATISIAAEAIQDFSLSKASTDEYLSIIRYQAGNLTSLIDQILKSMLSEQAVIPLNPADVSLADVLIDCIRQFQPQLKAAGAVLSLDVTEASVWVNGDAAHLGNVMANLLDNAIKYSGEKPVIHIQLCSDRAHAVFRITNKGTEIPEEYRDKIFDRFFRVPTGNVHNVKGYGLGLSYVKEIITRHGGTISMTSMFTQTTFTIHLPLISHETAQSIVA